MEYVRGTLKEKWQVLYLPLCLWIFKLSYKFWLLQHQWCCFGRNEERIHASTGQQGICRISLISSILYYKWCSICYLIKGLRVGLIRGIRTLWINMEFCHFFRLKFGSNLFKILVTKLQFDSELLQDNIASSKTLTDWETESIPVIHALSVDFYLFIYYYYFLFCFL